VECQTLFKAAPEKYLEVPATPKSPPTADMMKRGQQRSFWRRIKTGPASHFSKDGAEGKSGQEYFGAGVS